MWNFLDYNFWQTLMLPIAIIAAYLIGKKQNKINELISRTQDTVEIYASFGIEKYQNEKGEIKKEQPIIHVQNIGTRLIYLDKYIFNGRTYETNGQILPSTYSQSLNNFYRIDLPTNGENHISLEVFYHDLDDRFWSSVIFADLLGGEWKIKTLPRKINRS